MPKKINRSRPVTDSSEAKTAIKAPKADRVATGWGGGSGVEAVLEAMNTHRNDGVIQQQGFAALNEFCEDATAACRVGSVGGNTAVLDALKTHRQNEIIQEKGCESLIYLCRAPENVRILCESGAIEVAVSAINMHKGSIHVKTEGIGALMMLTILRDEQAFLRICEAGGPEIIADVLKAHNHDYPEISERCCGVISNLFGIASDEGVKKPGDLDEASRRFTEAGGAEGIVEALNAHIDLVSIQMEGLQALHWLCELDEENIGRVGKCGGITAVVGALKAHRGDAEVQSVACVTLDSICAGGYGARKYVKDNQGIAGGAGAVEAVVEALKSHHGNAQVAARGCRALSSLCWNHEINRSTALKAGALNAVEAALNTPEGSWINSPVDPHGPDGEFIHEYFTAAKDALTLETFPDSDEDSCCSSVGW